jgi:hypothetical protein
MGRVGDVNPRCGRQAVFCIVAAASALLYIFAVGFGPLAVCADCRHDDGLFIDHGRWLAEGKWLGRFNSFTLAKGPGYPVFLAISFWLGVPVTFAHALFFCGALALFSWAVFRVSRSRLFGVGIFILTLWHPIFLGPRILRDAIYTGQVFLCFGFALFAFFIAESNRSRVVYGALAGAALGWFWLTREEGVWILPAAIFLIICVIIDIRKRKLMPSRLGLPLASILVMFAVSQLSFAFVNWFAYGSFAGVDYYHERNFVAALDALQSVQHDPHVESLPVPHAVREQIYAVSPAFASLKPVLDPPAGAGWQHGCQYYPETCGDIATGWFLWALRDAVDRTGNYQTPRTAALFYRRLAQEVNDACRSGLLICRGGSAIALLPPISRAAIKRIPQSLAQAIAVVSLTQGVKPLPNGPSSGDLSAALVFLNHPVHNPTAEQRIILSGWYHSNDGIWPQFAIMKPDGAAAPMMLQRQASPDIADAFKDPRATNQRFTIEMVCAANCVLRTKRGDGTEIQEFLGTLGGSGQISRGGDGMVYVDAVDGLAGNSADPRIRLSNWIKNHVFMVYVAALPYALSLGIVGFLFSLVLGWVKREAGRLIAVAATAWILVAARILLVVVADISSIAGITGVYLMPALYLCVTATFLSFASLVHLTQIEARDIFVRRRLMRASGGQL